MATTMTPGHDNAYSRLCHIQSVKTAISRTLQHVSFMGQCGGLPFWGSKFCSFSMPLWLACPAGWGGGGIGCTVFSLWGFSQPDAVRWSTASS
jgi:hypothetical protein